MLNSKGPPGDPDRKICVIHVNLYIINVGYKTSTTQYEPYDAVHEQAHSAKVPKLVGTMRASYGCIVANWCFEA